MKAKSKTAKSMRGDMPAEPMPMKDSEHMSCRKIDNGWLISHSGYKSGKRFDSETFSHEKPKVEIETKGKRDRDD